MFVDVCVNGGEQYVFLGGCFERMNKGAHVRSSHGRYTDFQAFMSKMKNSMRGTKRGDNFSSNSKLPVNTGCQKKRKKVKENLKKKTKVRN